MNVNWIGNIACGQCSTSNRFSAPLRTAHHRSYGVGYSQNFLYVESQPPLLILDVQFNQTPIGIGSDFGDKPSGKKYLFDDSDNDEDNCDSQGWMVKPIELWSAMDTKNWLYSASKEIGQLYREISPKLVIPGSELLFLSKKDFIVYDQHFGEQLHDLLQEIGELKSSFRSSDDPHRAKKDKESVVELQPIKVPRERFRTKTRPARTGMCSCLQIWEFIRDLLLNPKFCPEWIRWENYKERTFHFVKTKEIAKLWGQRNDNEKMNYADFTRAMRYHYKTRRFGVLRPKPRHVFKFGPAATGLETQNPNFDLNYYREA